MRHFFYICIDGFAGDVAAQREAERARIFKIAETEERAEAHDGRGFIGYFYANQGFPRDWGFHADGMRCQS